ncbi:MULTISPECIES: ATP-binding protein [Pseudomonas]|uniref:AAA domain-containing protein, putative AbiEii toxin, Type IV TA system n=1 Tax=Pseudomonas syringae TaxID=317 RepID=A0AB37ZP48_PSESX|nr:MULTISPECIES: ATP-binding protein [Pseudomonas]MBI6669227.1 AAA family ATPase [Pseudomonas syringae]MBI6677167.1 AAA family ATPase [Pseudomonas syringae]MBI6837968.1 AAA family ATPase [Pseudomonas syringae]MCK9701739.1 ATP-binding protein [Pseudomonas syringae pv. syringae]MCK9735086.1 ATP-binding protein [Pseudomonas syringae pv. syringae]
MDVYYVGTDKAKRTALLASDADVILLLFDRWDDFNFKTTFPTYCRISGQVVELCPIRILFDEQKVSFSFLDELVANGWDGKFPVQGVHYISTPHSLTFYEQIDGHLDLRTAAEVAQVLCDASFMVHIAADPDSLRLTQSEGFSNSLQRERASVAAFLDGWRFFQQLGISIGNLVFNFKDTEGVVQPLQLNFGANSPLPHDINVLIGPNGVGKSQTLIQLVRSWLKLNPTEKEDVGFQEAVNINHVVVVSYSPFELFPMSSEGDRHYDPGERSDQGVYQYFGLRAFYPITDELGQERHGIRLSRDWPRRNAAYSLIQCVADDQRYGAIKTWSAKIKTLKDVLQDAIEFDEIALGMTGHFEEDAFFEEPTWVSSLIEVEPQEGEANLPEVYLLVVPTEVHALRVDGMKKYVHDRSGIVFIKDGQPVQLSSGQRLFSYIVANILGAMRRNSLIVIDEPELFLHPTLEIAFIGMLKQLLASYASKALLATHSLVTVRELPRHCVHVYERTPDGVFINHPPFETFGGDIQRISSYVFGDKSVSKPFEEWLKVKLLDYGSADALINALGDNINEEMLIQIHAMAEGKW